MSNEQPTTPTPTIGRPRKPQRGKLNLTIHPEIKDFALVLANARRHTISQLFEDLVEAEWNRIHGIVPVYPPQRTFAVSPSAAYATPGYPTQQAAIPPRL